MIPYKRFVVVLLKYCLKSVPSSYKHRKTMGEFSRDHKSSEQFVWRNRRHREMETRLTRSNVALDHTDSGSGGVDLGGFSVDSWPWVVWVRVGL